MGPLSLISKPSAWIIFLFFFLFFSFFFCLSLCACRILCSLFLSFFLLFFFFTHIQLPSMKYLRRNGISQDAVGIWNRIEAYRCRQLSPTVAFFSSTRLSTPKDLSRAARLTPLFPPPTIRTSVSIVSSSSKFRAGACKSASSSACASRLSTHVISTQIFHDTAVLGSVLLGSRRSRPLQLAPGDAVRKDTLQSMNCCLPCQSSCSPTLSH
jgi:hypothetical protein